MRFRLDTGFLLLSAVIFFAAGSCTKQEVLPESGSEEYGKRENVTFSSSFAKVRTELLPTLDVHWTEGDAISLFDAEGNVKMITPSGGSEAWFSGEIVTAPEYFMLYPYSQSSYVKNGIVHTTVKSAQYASESGFAQKSAVSVACSSGKAFTMKNVCGLVRLCISTDGITSVVLRGNGSEPVSGKVAVSFTPDGELSEKIEDGLDRVALLPAAGEDTIAPGEYFIAVLPATLEKGLNLLFTRASDNKCASRSSSTPAYIVRSGVLNLGTVDGGLDWNLENDEILDVAFLKDLGGSTTSWPFTESISGSTTANPVFKGEPKTFYLKSTGEPFTVFASGGIAHLTSSGQALKLQGKAGDYILLPARNGRYLTSVSLRTGWSGTCRSAAVRDASGARIIRGGEQMSHTFSAAGETYTWNLLGTKSGEAYRLNFETSGSYSAGNDMSAMIQQIVLTYSMAPSDYAGDEMEYDAPQGDKVPDFSRVGYHYGDKEIPEYPVSVNLNVPSDGADATSMIQDALDKAPYGTAVCLGPGTWNVYGTILIRRSGVVLRGSGDGTVIFACGDRKEDSNDRVLVVGENTKRTVDHGSTSRIVEDAFCGQMYVRVQNAERFSVGDRVVVTRIPNDRWISDLKMDAIYVESENVVQWKPQSYVMSWERVVTGIYGDKLFFENPLVMSITSDYCVGSVSKCSTARISECGIENIRFDSDFDGSLIDDTSDYANVWGSYQCDENHAWYAISAYSAENCWIRNVSSIHYAGSTVDLIGFARNVTVENCRSEHPISLIRGSRRYAFFAHKCELCLFRNCSADMDRHAFVTGFGTAGPNVFTRCRATNMYEDVGPHQHWATGFLYDCVDADYNITVQDRAGAGDGHGWSGANFVLWNCDIIPRTDGNSRSGRIVCQNPWVSAKNWAFGCGPASACVNTTRYYRDGLTRPDGEWTSKGVSMKEESLYEKQRSERKKGALEYPNSIEDYLIDNTYNIN